MNYSTEFSNDLFLWEMASAFTSYPNKTKSLLGAFPKVPRRKMPPNIEQLCNGVDVSRYKNLIDTWQVLTYATEKKSDELIEHLKLHYEPLLAQVDSGTLEGIRGDGRRFLDGFIAWVYLCHKYDGPNNVPFEYSFLEKFVNEGIKFTAKLTKPLKRATKRKDNTDKLFDELPNTFYWGETVLRALESTDRNYVMDEVKEATLGLPENEMTRAAMNIVSIGAAYAIASQLFAQEGLNLTEILDTAPHKRDEVLNTVGLCEAVQSTCRQYEYDPATYAFANLLLGIAKAYKKAGKCYRAELLRKAPPEEPPVDTIALEAQLATTKEENRRLREKLEALERSQDKAIVKVTRSLEKDIKVLKEDNKRLTSMKTELDALREFAFKVESESEEEPQEVSLASAMSGKKIILIGGPEPFLVKMRGLYPEFTIVSGTVATLNTDSLPQYDHIFLYTSHMSHSLYYKVMNICRARGLKYSYLGYHQNPRFIELEMVEGLKEKS